MNITWVMTATPSRKRARERSERRRWGRYVVTAGTHELFYSGAGEKGGVRA